MNESDLMFMINVSEHIKRPVDMLMYLGEYFKQHIRENNTAHANEAKTSEDVKREQDSFYLTHDIINLLGTACKQFIEKPRQELRISMALSRKPIFSKYDQLEKDKKEEDEKKKN